jgi:MFS family permease
MALAFYQLIPTLPVYIQEELGGDKGQIGMLMAVFTVSALIIRPFTGIMLDRYGRKWIFFASVFVFSLLFSGYMLAGSLLAMVVLRFVHGLAWGMTTTSSSTVIVDILPKSRMGEGIGFYGVSMTLAMALGPLVGIWIAGDGNYHLMFIETSGLSLLFFIMALFVKYPKYVPPRPLPRFRMSVLFERTSFPSGLNILIIMIPYGGVISFIALYGAEKGIEAAAGPFFIFCAIGIALTRYFAGKIFDRKGPRMLMILGISLEAASFPMLSLVPGEFGLYSAAVLFGMSFGITMPTMQAMVNNMVDADRRGVANSTLFTAVDLGIGAGMILVGLISKYLGLEITFLLCTFVCLAGLLQYTAFTDRHYFRNLPDVQHIRSNNRA